MATETEVERKRSELPDAESGVAEKEGNSKRPRLDADEIVPAENVQQEEKKALPQEVTEELNHKNHSPQKMGKRRNDGRGRNARDRGNTNPDDQIQRLPKRKICIAFGYCGIGYSGLQINNGVKTIEGDIFEAFCKLGAISEDNAVNPNKVGLQRSARTDRGVHAAGNLLTLKLILEPPGIGSGELLAKMNEMLPEFIRIWGFTKVESSFNARTNCESRQYEYLLPTYVFLPPKPGSHMHTMMQKWKSDIKEEENDPTKGDEYRPTLDYILNHPFWRAQGNDKSFAEDTAAKKAWRISSTQLDRVRDIFSKYEGAHNFHNFTLGKAFRDRSSHRNMLKLTISEPKLINNTEWVSIKFHGQSFMLHQIRKMIGLLILIGRSTAPSSLVPETYGPARIHVPKAPGLGLLLEQPIFDGYNRRLQENMKRQNEDNGPSKGDGGVIKEEIVFSRYAEQKEAFKNKWIYDRIYKEEEETHEYVKFLQYLDVLSGDDFEYLNPKGIIPASAIIKVGEQKRPTNSSKGHNDKAKVGQGNPDEEEFKQESDDEDNLLHGDQTELEG